jgi:hypothetical protein
MHLARIYNNQQQTPGGHHERTLSEGGRGNLPLSGSNGHLPLSSSSGHLPASAHPLATAASSAAPYRDSTNNGGRTSPQNTGRPSLNRNTSAKRELSCARGLEGEGTHPRPVSNVCVCVLVLVVRGRFLAWLVERPAFVALGGAAPQVGSWREHRSEAADRAAALSAAGGCRVPLTDNRLHLVRPLRSPINA